MEVEDHYHHHHHHHHLLLLLLLLVGPQKVSKFPEIWRNPAPVEVSSLSHYLQAFYIPGGVLARFLACCKAAKKKNTYKVGGYIHRGLEGSTLQY